MLRMLNCVLNEVEEPLEVVDGRVASSGREVRVNLSKNDLASQKRSWQVGLSQHLPCYLAFGSRSLSVHGGTPIIVLLKPRVDISLPHSYVHMSMRFPTMQ